MRVRTRRAFLGRVAATVSIGLTVPTACSTFSADSSLRSRRPRIGFLSTGFPSIDPAEPLPFVQAMSQIGYVEGRDFTFERRYAETDPERLPALAAELVQLPVDVLITSGGANSALAAKAATTRIPIVFHGLADPVGKGIVRSLTHPAGNITGVSGSDGQGPKQVEALKEAAPGASRIALLFNSAEANDASRAIETAVAVADTLRVATVQVRLDHIGDLDRALESISRHSVDGLVDFHGAQFYGANLAHLPKLLDFAAQSRLPQSFNGASFARAGGLIGIGASRLAVWRVMARLVDRILMGAQPADLPVQITTPDEFAINLTMARKIGLTIPESVLRQATEVF